MFKKKWKPSKNKIKEFVEKMDNINLFCNENEISQSRDSYYFILNDEKYRVSNHTMERSNKNAYKEDNFGNLIQIRELYHNLELEKDVICITASKTRIIEIYNNLKNGKVLDKRGNIVVKND